MRPRFLPPSTPELHPDVMRRHRDFRRLITWLLVTFAVIAATFFGIGFLAAMYQPTPSLPPLHTFQPIKVIT